MTEQPPPSTGEAVARWRYRKQWTQEQLADAAGLSLSAIKAIERGARAGRMATLHRLASALGIRTSDLLVPSRGAEIADEEPVASDALMAIRQVLTPPLGALPDPGPAPEPNVWHDTLRYAESLYDDDNYDAALAAVPVLLGEARALHAADPTRADALAHAHLYAAIPPTRCSLKHSETPPGSSQNELPNLLAARSTRTSPGSRHSAHNPPTNPDTPNGRPQ